MKATLYRQLCSNQLLISAWQRVKAKDSIGGIDGITLLDFEKNLASNIGNLKKNLETKQIKPLPYKQIEIPKKDGDKRRLSMLSISDKIVQQAIRLLIEPRCEKLFLRNSYGYRPKVSAVTAIRRVAQECCKKVNSVALCLDIDDFFDNVDHEILKSRLLPLIYDEEVIRLIMLYVKMGSVDGSGRWVAREKGIPQGASFSPLLANIYLHSLDQFAVSKSKTYVRYADNIAIVGENMDEMHKIKEEIEGYLNNRLNLSLNPPLFAEIDTGFEFLGVKISKKELTITDDKYKHLAETITALEFNESGMTPKSTKTWDGMVNHYGKLINQTLLEQLDNKFLETVKRFITNNPQMYSSQAQLLKAFAGVTLFSKKNNSDRKVFNATLIEHYKSVKVGKAIQSDEAKNEALIKSRKLEFQRKEVEHKELIVSSPGTFIGLSNMCVVVRSKGKELKKLQTANLSHIIINGDGVSLSSNVLSFCMKNKIPIDIFDFQGAHIGSFLSSKYLEISLWQKQAQASSTTNQMIALAIIDGKIKNQFGLIKYFHKYHKSTSAALTDRFNTVKEIFEKFHQFSKKPVGEDEKFYVDLNTYESSMAQRYWGYIRELLLDDQIGFESRVHKGATDVFNCMLNYGYAILYTRIWQTLLAVGINPYQSIIHHRHPGNPTLVYDVIEIFRSQAVDRIAISMVQKGTKPTVENGRLSEATKKQLSKNIVERLNRFEYYRGGSMRLINIIESQAQELADSFSTECKFKPYVAKW